MPPRSGGFPPVRVHKPRWRWIALPLFAVLLCVALGTINRIAFSTDRWPWTAGTLLLILAAAGSLVQMDLNSISTLARRRSAREPDAQQVFNFLIVPIVSLVAGVLGGLAPTFALEGKMGNVLVALAFVLVLGFIYALLLSPMWRHWRGNEIDP